jgi:hypothetical protein
MTHNWNYCKKSPMNIVISNVSSEKAFCFRLGISIIGIMKIIVLFEILATFVSHFHHAQLYHFRK